MPKWVRNSSATSRSGARSRPYARSVTLISAMVFSTVFPRGCSSGSSHRAARGPTPGNVPHPPLFEHAPYRGSGGRGHQHDDAENDHEREQEQDDRSFERARPAGKELKDEHGGQHDDADGKQPEGPDLDRYHAKPPPAPWPLGSIPLPSGERT